jgi:multimeric flavodoxin WrbA
MMKVLCINSSPRMDKGNTAVLLTPFMEGMQSAGAKTELLYTKRMDIRPCEEEYHCWVTTPGECFIKDDMKKVLEKMRSTDLWVFAAPIFTIGVPGPLVNLLDRILPLTTPALDYIAGHTRIGIRDGLTGGKVVLISTCYYWELDTFGPLLAQMKHLCLSARREFGGALLRPHTYALQHQKDSAVVKQVQAAVIEAGRQVVLNGRIDPKTERIVSQPLITLDAYLKQQNNR